MSNVIAESYCWSNGLPSISPKWPLSQTLECLLLAHKSKCWWLAELGVKRAQGPLLLILSVEVVLLFDLISFILYSWFSILTDTWFWSSWKVVLLLSSVLLHLKCFQYFQVSLVHPGSVSFQEDSDTHELHELLFGMGINVLNAWSFFGEKVCHICLHRSCEQGLCITSI